MNFELIIALLNELQAKIAELQLSLADAQAFAQAQYDAGYAKGLEDGKAQGGDVQGQIDAAVAAAVAPLNAQIVQLQMQISDLQGQIDGIPSLVSQAVRDENSRVMGLLDAAEVVIGESLDRLSGAVKEAAVDLKAKIKLP